MKKNDLHFILPPSSFIFPPTPSLTVGLPPRIAEKPVRAVRRDHSSGGAGGGQSHQLCVAQTPQSVQTHTPQTSVPSQALAQHVAAGAMSNSAGSRFSASGTCPLHDRPPRSSFLRPLLTDRATAASIASFPPCCT